MMNRILSAGPIPKRLVCFQFTPAEQFQLVNEMLADRREREAGKDLEPTDASNLIEFLDSVRSTSSSNQSLMPGNWG